MEIFRVLIVSYLVVTLGSTGLAKAVNNVSASAGMIREGVFSSHLARPVITALAGTEVALAGTLALGFQPEIAGFITAGLFALFAAYRLVVAAKLKVEVCSCAGYVRTDPATPAAVAGAVLACGIVSVIAGASLFIGSFPRYPVSLVAISALVLPLVILAAGFPARRKLNSNTAFTSRYIAVGTEEISLKGLHAAP